MKRILMSLLTVGVVAIVAIFGTSAFFSDTETSVGNTFAAGAIDLLIDNTSYGFDWNDPEVASPSGEWGLNQVNSWTANDLDNQLFFSFEDLKPGDYGEDTISLRVNDNDAWACMAFDLTGMPENNLTDPEAEAGDASEDEGELQNYLSFLFWYDDGDNVLEVDEEIIPDLEGLPGEIFDGNWLTIADSMTGTALPGGTTRYIGKGWCFGAIEAAPVVQDNYGAPTADTTGFTCSGEGEHNDAQTDGIVVDVHFYAEQSRNNDAFTCASLEPVDGGDEEEEILVGAALGDYSAPPTCGVTVGDGNDFSTIQAAVDATTEPQTICVEDGEYNETVVIDTPLTLAAINGPSNSATILGGVQVDSSDVNIKGFNIIPGDVPADPGNIGVFINGSYSNIRIDTNIFDGSSVTNDRGVLTTTGAVLNNIQIRNNHFHDLVTGIYLNPHTGNVEITYNDFDDNTAGVGGFTNAYVAYNEFGAHTDEAIGSDTTYDGSSKIEFNNFLNNSEVVKFGAWPNPDNNPPAVLAPNNFWDTDPDTQTVGNVDFTPASPSQYNHQ